MLEDISLVTVLCSSTAAAVEVTYSQTSWIALLIDSSAETTSPEMPNRNPRAQRYVRYCVTINGLGSWKRMI
jgi:hypothetical protein